MEECMKRMRKPLVLVATLLFFSGPTLAVEITVCNQFGTWMQVWYAYQGNPARKEYQASGSHGIDSNRCKKLEIEADYPSDHIYLRAVAASETVYTQEAINAMGFCVSEGGPTSTADATRCKAGEVKEQFQKFGLERIGSSYRVNMGTHPNLPQLASRSPPIPPDTKVGVVEDRCVYTWDGPPELHSQHMEITLQRQALKTRMKKLRRCAKLQVTGPVDIEGIAQQYVQSCINYALNKDSTRHILTLIVSVVADAWTMGSDGMALTQATVYNYGREVASNTIDCLTDTGRLATYFGERLKGEFSSRMTNTTEWIFWDL